MHTIKAEHTLTHLYGKDFLSLKDVSPSDINALLTEASLLKQHPIQPIFQGKTLAMIFEKSSTRTRVSFEAGMAQLGGTGLFLSSSDLQLGRGETVADTAKVLSGFVDAIMIRTFEHEKVEELAEHADIPVINGLTDRYHPCQALADLLTIQEIKGKLKGVKAAYIGDGNNVAHSLMIGCAKMGCDIAVASPKGYEVEEEAVNAAKEAAAVSGAKVTLTENPQEAVQDADVIYSDVFTSMGQEEETQQRLNVFAPYQVNASLVSLAKPDYTFLHCLPAHREEEVTSEIIDGPNSAVFQQAENRLHAQKALLKALLYKQDEQKNR
ncbi:MULTISPECIES: ornithine carbamoyltransferase [Bacillus amyloliquefaciens group]|uniref:ornithine carbamoyltransferase n=1 Tax=Bacillus amyloliquefaciens group TaxID=1938374 RepID=UPI000CB88493|nr:MULTISPECIES: ornithine carbamoyltransferase [Bacillus amyloliquefaciens group]MCG1016507.1 ornithine carbamoyltransferase [Bacillus velezensis]MCR6608051.1 ornithine carbamoyltransferase [Bacillus velezensis]MCR6615812.1 ornithine carbamoyltransferase [Bacillus amyloliquefaciens]MEC0389960.1 ornithine carbamoyltransferase [Bacillus velezensis]PJN82909.1 ornithine carbamoyltransferase [Bacillus velezensis]